MLKKIERKLKTAFQRGRSSYKLEKEYKEYLWEEPGFHRTLGSILFQYVPYVAISAFSIIYFVIVLPSFIPAESVGQDQVFKYLLGFFFVLAELGIGDAIQRFLSEKRINQPKNTIQYLQFFIWFRMLTGLLVVTGISIWVFLFLPNFELLTYSMWFFLSYSLLQYPGFWDVYIHALRGYQQFNKVNYINIAMLLVNILTGYGSIQLFKYLGSLSPVIGETMGSTFGFVVSMYANKIISFFISARFFKRIIKNIDPSWTLRKCFKVEFTSQISHECLSFGIQSMFSTFLDTGAKMLITYLAISWLPNYATVYGILFVTMNVAMLVSIDIPITPIVSEAFNNRKLDLTEYYLGHGLKYCGIFSSMFASTVLAVAPVFLVLTGPYQLAVLYLPYVAIGRYFWAFNKLLEDSTTGCNRPFYRFYYILIENISRVILMVIFILHFQMAWIGYLLAEIGSLAIKTFTGWLIFKIKIMKPYMSLMQTVILPLISSIIQYFVLTFLINVLFSPLASVFGNFFTIIIFVIIGFLGTPLTVWWPIYTLLGGWDPVGLDILEEATEISGISKPVAQLFNKVVKKLARVSPLYNKFPIHFRSAQFELDQLRVMMGREPRASLHVWDLLPQMITLDHDEIEKRAFEIFSEHLPYDDYVWLLAEITLKIKDVIIRRPFGPVTRVRGEIELNVDFLNDKPNKGKIQRLAEEIHDHYHPTLEELHWLIAERRTIYNFLKRQKKGKIKKVPPPV
ncbi:MAG: lipopolysaccharide biosynthesis protein [Candidatus Hodarchaeota archaeon]